MLNMRTGETVQKIHFLVVKLICYKMKDESTLKYYSKLQHS